MKLFQSFGDNINYEDILQLDGAFAITHVNYNKSPIFNGKDSHNLAQNSRKVNLLRPTEADDISSYVRSFNGTEQNLEKDDQISLWQNFWLEYVNAFNTLTESLPDSVVTAYVGRQAVEIGFKYLLLKANVKAKLTHNLGELSEEFFAKCSVTDDYMKWVDGFCKKLL